jgi:hypothetical protein
MVLAVVMTCLLMAPAGGAAEEVKPKAVEPKKGPLTLPADAVEIAPMTWRHKDAQGKTWIYRRIPFGLVRYEETEAAGPAQEKEQPSAPLEAFDEGDQVRFERATPFGKSTWRRKKSDLAGEEREAWEKARERAAAAKKPAKE